MEHLSMLFDFLSRGAGFCRAAAWLPALIVLIRTGWSLLGFRREPELWGYLTDGDGTRYPLEHWEVLIGRGRRSDVRLRDPSIARTHAVLTRYDDGSWCVGTVRASAPILRNGKAIADLGEILSGDRITLGDRTLTFLPLSAAQTAVRAEYRTPADWNVSPVGTLFFLTLFQLLAVTALWQPVAEEYRLLVLFSFGILCFFMWTLYFLMRLVGLRGFEIETIAFFLCTLGLAVIASSCPEELVKQLIAMAGGVVIYLFVGWSLRDLDRAGRVRILAAGVGVALLAFNLLFGREVYGAKNWVYIGGWSFQPSELVKLSLIYAGAAPMQSMVRRRNLWGFVIYAGVCCGCLALLNDFGTALIFFIGFLVMAYMRSGDLATLGLICAGTGYAGVLAVRFKPYIITRFSVWGHVWEDALDKGWQQTRSMMCIASGGLFGLGAGNGLLKYVAASDTDLVFGFVGEEWGLILAVIMVLFVVLLAAFAVRSAAVSRSAFHSIGACAAMTMLLFGAMLNVFGTVDLLPLTGVTFPFVSNGGSGMLSAWGLLAFVKGTDTRREASFALRRAGWKKRGAEDPAEAVRPVEETAPTEEEEDFTEVWGDLI